MWNPSKKILFLLIIINATFSGVFFTLVNWGDLGSLKEGFRELQLPILFFLLSIYFVFPYVKKIQDEKKAN